MPTAAIIGTGARAGGRLLSSAEIDARLGKAAGWLQGASGVTSRPVAAQGECQESLALDAARRALADAGTPVEDIDLLLFASAVGRQPIPATAALLKRELGLSSSAFPAFDVNATCLSAVAAMDIAALYISAGRARNVLIVASEIATRALPWQDDPATAALFGDGAAAFVMSAEAPHSLRVRDVALETWSDGYDFCALPAGGTRYDFHTDREAFERNAFFRMDGHALFKLTRAKVPAFITRLLDRAGWKQGEVDLVIPHQASPLALEHMIRKCGFSRDQVVSTVETTGNLVAASIPMTLDTARREGRVRPGSRILLIGTSAGVSIGGATLEA
ncbi:hypothetical protein K1X12_14120 [Hyphomonas sp. WL0036]|uniref:3-oxoacyl-ACP synthase III family protein n=1 Tax=Hyphomonas sediminis TaxID=2866160 RepID=UPI001C7EDD2C|nr:3-oxoacyl-[acyl-carrier-protein] synthase III C-terminal domain-containing protein [Hyphomonas sediminis]MBY9068044.1 hypothetical protein [Hyphomonas sediminis]